MVSHKKIAARFIGLGLLVAICLCLGGLYFYYAANTLVVINHSSGPLESFIADLPKGSVQLGPIKPRQSRYHIFNEANKDGDLSFHIISKSRELRGYAGQYLDGMVGEHFVIIIEDGDSYRVKTRFQVFQGEQRWELLNK
jgi:hypothetical protein